MRTKVIGMYNALYAIITDITNVEAEPYYMSMITYRLRHISVAYIGTTNSNTQYIFGYKMRILSYAGLPHYPGFMLYHTSLSIRDFNHARAWPLEINI